VPDNRRTIGRFGLEVRGEQLATAVLTRLARPAWFEDVARGLIGNPNKSGYWGEFGDREGRYLGQLIEHLRTMRMT
jgi:hypothetical protein